MKSLVSALLLGLAGSAGAAEFWMCAQEGSKTMPDGTTVAIWGFVLDDNANLADGCGLAQADIPGPVLTVAPNDASLIIHLANRLPPVGVNPTPVSLMIPDTNVALAPSYNADGRVRSFTTEVPPGATGDFVWNNLAPGTHVLESASHPAVQVQMGLFAVVKRDAAPGMAYPGIPYDHDLTLVYSEIDPALHAAVKGGSYGSAAYPSTNAYRPKYFLVNGAAYTPGAPAIPAAVIGSTSLIRLVNMGLDAHVPMFQSPHVTLVAEDGHPYPFPRLQYSVELPAGKSRDALLTPASLRSFSIYDRALSGVSTASAGTQGGGASIGGMVNFLDVYAPLQPAVSGVAVANHLWSRQPLPAGFTNPVVFTGVPGSRGASPGVARVARVSATGFEVRFQEWDYLDGLHMAERIPYLVLEPGRYLPGDGTLWEVGTLQLGGNGDWAPVSFAQPLPGVPTLLLGVQSVNGPEAVTVRARGVTNAGFEAALFEQESNSAHKHLAETVAYLAIYTPTPRGGIGIGGHPLPYLLGKAAIDHRFSLVGSPGHALQMEEEQSFDLETIHGVETVNFMELNGELFAQDVTALDPDPAAPRLR